LTQAKDLEPTGALTESKTYKYSWENVERQHESYFGINVSLHYYVRVTISRSLNMHITKQLEFFQRLYQVAHENTGNIKMKSELKIVFTLNLNTTNPNII